MIRAAALLALAAALSACLPDRMQMPGAAAVTEVVVARVYPDLSAGPMVTCVLENATPFETERLNQASGEAPTEAQITVLTILERPATRACLSARGIELA